MPDPFGLGGMGAAAMLDDEPFDPDDESPSMPDDTVETQLLLGDRKSQEIGELFTVNLFRMLEKSPRFAGLQGMVLQVSLALLRGQSQDSQGEVRTVIEAVKSKLEVQS